jgi:phospholipid transport system substrate-binding protein
MKTTTTIILAGVLLSLPVLAQAAAPMKTVEDHVNQLMAVLGDPSLSGAAGEEKKKEAVRTISNSLFDFGELARFTLGRNWRDFNPQQQDEFADLYRRLLEGIYMGRLLQYKDEKVVFNREAELSSTRSEVQTHIVAGSGNIPIDYRLVQKGGVWKVYDLVIENASLAKNYRSQFNSILTKDPPDKLIDLLRQKVKEQEAGDAK